MKQTNRVRKNGNSTLPSQQTKSAKSAVPAGPTRDQITVTLPAEILEEVCKATVSRNSYLPKELRWDMAAFIRDAIQRQCNRQLAHGDALSDIENAVWRANGLITALIRVLVDISETEIVPKNTEVCGLSFLCDETKAKLSDAFNRTHAYALGKAGGAQ